MEEPPPPKTPTQTETPQPSQQHPPPASVTPVRSRVMQKSSFSVPESDPWGSPDLHRGHNHSSYTDVSAQSNGITPPAVRTTSNFTTTSESTTHQTTTRHTVERRESGGGGWGGYNGGPSDPFPGAGLGGEGFGAPPSGDGGSNPPGLGRSLGGGRIASTGPEETITVTTIAEKEGMFMFQHRNYEVASARRNSKVIRRYSDFVWLLDCLHKRYPFRQLPLLPPKRVASEYSPYAWPAVELK